MPPLKCVSLCCSHSGPHCGRNTLPKKGLRYYCPSTLAAPCTFCCGCCRFTPYLCRRLDFIPHVSTFIDQGPFRLTTYCCWWALLFLVPQCRGQCCAPSPAGSLIQYIIWHCVPALCFHSVCLWLSAENRSVFPLCKSPPPPPKLFWGLIGCWIHTTELAYYKD